MQRSCVAGVFRTIGENIPTFDELAVSETVRQLAMLPRGLVVVTGSTGCGKSTTLAAAIRRKFFGMPGHQSVWGVYSSGRYGIVDKQSPNQIPPELHPASFERGTWWMTYLFDQALWVDPTDQTRSWGVFGNFGISDGKPNPIRWSAIFGIGGASPISGRKHDTFGLAYYYLGFSNDFKDVARVGTPVRDERGLELFYNVGLTPWLHITPDLQVITPSWAAPRHRLS